MLTGGLARIEKATIVCTMPFRVPIFLLSFLSLANEPRNMHWHMPLLGLKKTEKVYMLVWSRTAIQEKVIILNKIVDRMNVFVVPMC